MKRILCGALSALLIFTGIQLPVRAETAGTEETAAVQPEETAATEPMESVPVETQAPETIGAGCERARPAGHDGQRQRHRYARGAGGPRHLQLPHGPDAGGEQREQLPLCKRPDPDAAAVRRAGLPAVHCSAVLSGCRVTRLLTGGDYTEVSMANAWCSWVSVGGSYSSKMLERAYPQSCRSISMATIPETRVTPASATLSICQTAARWEEQPCPVLSARRDLCRTADGHALRHGIFAGWYTAASGGAHITNSTPAAENLIVYAHWSSTPVENPNEDNGGSGEDPVTLKTSEACIQFIKVTRASASSPTGTTAVDDRLRHALREE